MPLTASPSNLPGFHFRKFIGLVPAALLSLLLAISLLSSVGCSSDLKDLSLSFEDNDGSTLTTTPGDPVKPEWLYGKWDVDGELTNTANGNPGIDSIPQNINEDIFGIGWKFEPDGVLKVDVTGGFEMAHYQLDGCTLRVRLPGRNDESVYFAHFQYGYLYLKEQGKDADWTVFEKNKFFGF